MGKASQSLQEGFNKFVVKTINGCWDWKGCAPKNPGYGQFRSNMKLYRSHIASWTIHKGKVPKDMCVCHSCDNPRCSNPEHLFLGTKKDNNLDMIRKGRNLFFGRSGSENHRAKLDKKKAHEIRNLIGISQHEIARLYGISQASVSNIKKYKVWG